jgi:hypothetical protein
MLGQIRPCPLCGGPAACWLREGWKSDKMNACPRCGTFLVEPTLPAQPWARLAPEDIRLVVFLPAYIRDQNQCQHVPLLTLENWRTLARRGRLVALRSTQLATVPKEPSAKSTERK